MKPTIISYYTEGTAYAEYAARLKESADGFGYKSRIVPVQCGGDWIANVNMKARFVAEMREEVKGPLLFLDSDCWLRRPLPLFDLKVADILIDICTPSRLRPGMSAQQYKHWNLRSGGMWNSGIVLLADTRPVRSLLSKWVSETDARPGVWDQVNLQRAWLSMKRRPSVEALPEDYRADVDRIGHKSGFHAVWSGGGKPLRRVLLLGSAPYVVDWWKVNGARYLADGWTIAAMNNAWRVPGADLDYWLHPDDFAGERPTHCVNNATLKGAVRYDSEMVWNRPGNWMVKPTWHEDAGVHLTFVDSLHHLLNEAKQDGVRICVAVVGSDLIYPKDGATHFYGNGTPDPLRYEQGRVRNELRVVQARYEEHGSMVLNVGGQDQSALPFLKV